MNKFMRLFALLLVAVAIVLVVLAFKFGMRKPAPPMAATPATSPATSATSHQAMYAVATAASTLPPGVAITVNDVTMVEHTQALPGSFIDAHAVVGRIPAVRIAKGMPLTHDLMMNDLSLRLRPGERAMAVPVTEVAGVGNDIHPGDYVDVFFSLKPQTGAHDWKLTQSRLLLPRLRVLAYGTRQLPQPQASSTTADKAKQATNNAGTFRASAAVLAVPVNKVNRLLLAEHYGKLSLVLRNPQDPGMPDVKLFPQPGPVLLAKAAGKHATAAAGDPPTDPIDKADNHAYAGIRLGSFADGDPGRWPRRRVQPRHRTPPHHRAEIILGTQRSHITVYNRPGGTP